MRFLGRALSGGARSETASSPALQFWAGRVPNSTDKVRYRVDLGTAREISSRSFSPTSPRIFTARARAGEVSLRVVLKPVKLAEAFRHLVVWEALAPGRAAWPAHVARPVAAVLWTIAAAGAAPGQSPPGQPPPVRGTKAKAADLRDWLLVTRYVAGGELLRVFKQQGEAWWLGNEGGAAQRQGACVTRQLLKAVRALAARGLAHGDLHAGQVWVRGSGTGGGWLSAQLGDLSDATSAAPGWPFFSPPLGHGGECEPPLGGRAPEDLARCRRLRRPPPAADMWCLAANVLLPLFTGRAADRLPSRTALGRPPPNFGSYGAFLDQPWAQGTVPLFDAFVAGGGMRLVWRMLRLEPSERIKPGEALASPFLRNACAGEAPVMVIDDFA